MSFQKSINCWFSTVNQPLEYSAKMSTSILNETILDINSENQDNDKFYSFTKSKNEKLLSIPQENDDKLICFTDGSSLSNGKINSKSGFSTYFPYRNIKISVTIHGDNPTNNRAELKGILESYKQAYIIDPERKKTLIIYTDSMLCVNSLSKWLTGWKKQNWLKSDNKPVKNIDLLKLIDAEQSKRYHEYRHVKAHTGKKDWISLQNEIADKLATEAARRNC